MPRSVVLCVLSRRAENLLPFPATDYCWVLNSLAGFAYLRFSVTVLSPVRCILNFHIDVRRSRSISLQIRIAMARIRRRIVWFSLSFSSNFITLFSLYLTDIKIRTPTISLKIQHIVVETKNSRDVYQSYCTSCIFLRF